jgi:hypothetical protein
MSTQSNASNHFSDKMVQVNNQLQNLFLFNAHDNAEASAKPATSPVLNVKMDGIFLFRIFIRTANKDKK